jgi:hypothetical protein
VSGTPQAGECSSERHPGGDLVYIQQAMSTGMGLGSGGEELSCVDVGAVGVGLGLDDMLW